MPVRPTNVSGRPPKRVAKADHFLQAAGNERCTGIVLVPETGNDARGDRHDVFNGGAKFAADFIVASINTQILVGKQQLNGFRVGLPSG